MTFFNPSHTGLNKSMTNPQISVVSPIYNAENTVEDLCLQILEELDPLGITYEMILVDDGSVDSSWNKILMLASLNSNIKGIKLSRNFGQHNTIFAGLMASSGQWVVVMDCDLQDRPDQIPYLYQYAVNNAFEIVYGQRSNRADSRFRRIMSNLFYTMLGYLTDTVQDSSIASFGIYSRKAVSALLSMNDYYKSFLPMMQWIGFSTAKIPVKHSARAYGRSNYSVYKLLSLALHTSIAFSDKPIKLLATSGLFISITSLTIGVIYILAFALGYSTVPGYSSIIISLWFSTGLIIFTLGILGLYLGKVYETTKKRPYYIVDTSVNI